MALEEEFDIELPDEERVMQHESTRFQVEPQGNFPEETSVNGQGSQGSLMTLTGQRVYHSWRSPREGAGKPVNWWHFLLGSWAMAFVLGEFVSDNGVAHCRWNEWICVSTSGLDPFRGP